MVSVTEEELARAIERTLVASGRLPAEEARPTARIVLAYFGPADSVLDNTLSKEDRDRFYLLEDAGLLTSEEEDATVSRGRTWRIHYWMLQKDRVHRAGERPVEPTPAPASVYESIPQQEWRASRSDTESPPAA